MKKTKVAEMLVVDDHQLILEGIASQLSALPQVSVADAVTSGAEAQRLIEERDYDLYLLDVSIPDVSGFDLIRLIRELNDEARIIVNTMHEEVWIVNRLAASGVNAVVLKSSDASSLREAVLAVLAGETYACDRFRSLCGRLQGTPVELRPHDMPTPREKEVLQALAKGMNSNEIANLMEISPNTVETFRKRLITKFEAKNAIDLVMKAVKRGWVEMD